MNIDVRNLVVPALVALFGIGAFILAEMNHDFIAGRAKPHPVRVEGWPVVARDTGKAAQEMAKAGTYLPPMALPELLPRGIYWVKIAVRNEAADPSEALILLSRWDRVTVYNDTGERVLAITGQAVGWKERFEHQSLQVGFLNLFNDVTLAVPGNRTETFLLKLETSEPHESYSLSHITTASSAYRVRVHFENQAIVSAALIGALALLGCLAILAFLATFQASYGWYAAHVGSVVFYWLLESGIGFGFPYPSGQYFIYIEAIAVVGISTTMLLFARSHLQFTARGSKIGRFLGAGALVVPVLSAAFWSSPFDFINLSFVFAYVAALIAGLSAHYKVRRDAHYFVAAILCSSVGYLLYWFGSLSVLDFNGVPLAMGANVAEAILLTLSLALRYRNVSTELARERERRSEMESIVQRERQEALEARQEELEREVQLRTSELSDEKARTERLLRNMLPQKVAEELKRAGKVAPQRHDEVTVVFSDFRGFTSIASTVPASTLVSELDEIFSAFDEIMIRNGVEKIKTVGDAYVAACGLPDPCSTHALQCARAACEMIWWLDQRNSASAIKWPIRIGMHSGPVVAGVVGRTKYAYDFWGDTVNIAARLESSSEPGRINVSAHTMTLLREHFECHYRGKLDAKGKGEIDMYFVGRPHASSHQPSAGPLIPGEIVAPG